MVIKMQNLYTALIETMIKQGITENSTVDETAKDFSSNNIKRIIITPDVIGVNYHIGESKYKVISASDKQQIYKNSRQPKYINCLYGLTKPFVCGNIETILIFTKSFNMPEITLSEKEFDIRGKYSQDSVLPLYRQNNIKGTIQNELKAHIREFYKNLTPDEVVSLRNIPITGNLKQNFESFDKMCSDEHLRKLYRDYTNKVIKEIVNPKIEMTHSTLMPYIKGFSRFRGLYIYNDKLVMQDFLEVLKGKEPMQKVVAKFEYHPEDYYKYRCKEQSSIYGDIDIKIAEKLDKMKEEFVATKEEEIIETKEENIVEQYYNKLQSLIERKGFNSLKPYMQYRKLSDTASYENLLGFYLGNLISLYEKCPVLVKTIYQGKSLRILNIKGFQEELNRLKDIIDIKITDSEKIACNNVCASIERVFL